MSTIGIPADATPVEVSDLQQRAWEWLRDNRCPNKLAGGIVDCDLKRDHDGPHNGTTYEAYSDVRGRVRVTWEVPAPF